jgi:hypothetical protein
VRFGRVALEDRRGDWDWVLFGFFGWVIGDDCFADGDLCDGGWKWKDHEFNSTDESDDQFTDKFHLFAAP